MSRPQVWLVGAAVGLCGPLLVAGAAQRGSSPDAPLIVADLIDDTISPIARFAEGNWITTWPEPEAADVPVPALADIPSAWLAGPVPRQWRLWQHDQSRLVTVVGARRLERDPAAGCTSPAVLQLQKPPGAASYYFGEQGIAVNTDQVIDDVRVINQQSADWPAMEAGVMAAIGAAERHEIDVTKPSWRDEQGAIKLDLAQLPLVVVLSHPSASTPETSGVYSFEASRRTTTKKGAVVGFKVYGWIRRGSAGRWTTDGVASSTIDAEGPHSLMLVAGIRLKEHEYWVVAETATESLVYAIYEITASGAIKRLVVNLFEC